MADPVAILALVAALGSGLMAGLFFAFSVTVMQALAQQPPAQGMAAMRAINVTIINPLFLGVFFGTAVACLLLVAIITLGGPTAGGGYLLGGSLCYLLGNILVTLLCNVPRNNRLESLRPQAAEAAAYWADYLRSWTAWNHLRSATGVAAMALLIIGLDLH